MQNYLIVKYEDGNFKYLRWAEYYTGGTQTVYDVLSDYDNAENHGDIIAHTEVSEEDYHLHRINNTYPGD